MKRVSNTELNNDSSRAWSWWPSSSSCGGVGGGDNGSLLGVPSGRWTDGNWGFHAFNALVYHLGNTGKLMSGQWFSVQSAQWSPNSPSSIISIAPPLRRTRDISCETAFNSVGALHAKIDPLQIGNATEYRMSKSVKNEISLIAGTYLILWYGTGDATNVDIIKLVVVEWKFRRQTLLGTSIRGSSLETLRCGYDIQISMNPGYSRLQIWI